MNIESRKENNVLILNIKNKLTDEDYTAPKMGINALVEKQASVQDKLRIVINIDGDLGWEKDAIKNEKKLADEFKGRECRLALVGCNTVTKTAIAMITFFIDDAPLQIKYFTDEATAIAWVKN